MGGKQESEPQLVRFLIGSRSLEELAAKQDAEEADGPEDDERDDDPDREDVED